MITRVCWFFVPWFVPLVVISPIYKYIPILHKCSGGNRNSGAPYSEAVILTSDHRERLGQLYGSTWIPYCTHISILHKHFYFIYFRMPCSSLYNRSSFPSQRDVTIRLRSNAFLSHVYYMYASTRSLTWRPFAGKGRHVSLDPPLPNVSAKPPRHAAQCPCDLSE